MLRKVLLGLLLLLVALYVAADFVARSLADSGVAKELQTSFGLAQRPDISLGGFPFIPKLVSGRFDEVHATARDVPASRGIRFARVDLTLRDVTVSTLRVLRGADSSIGIGGGEGTATLSGAEITDALAGAGIHVKVSVRSGTARVDVAGSGASVPVDATVEGDALVLRSPSLQGAVRVPLSFVIPAVRFTGVTVKGKRAVLSFEISRTRLTISGAAAG